VKKLNPLLRLAAISGAETAIQLHIHRGDDINARDRDGLTPLMLAAARKKKGVVRLLLDAGANPLLTDSNGRDAVYFAAEAGCSDTVACLFDALERIKPGIIDKVEMTKERRLHGVETITIDDESTLKSATKTLRNFQSIESSVTSHIDTSLTVWQPPTVMNETAESVISVLIDKTQTPDASILELDVAPLYPDFASDWEEEVVPAPPEGDDSVIEVACRIHETIARHRAVDNYEDWTDVDLDLPERAAPLKGNEDDAVIFQFLLAALREGVVSEQSLAKASSGADGVPNDQDMRLLAMVAGELGAIIVEWDGDESPHMEEPSHEEVCLLDDAIVFAKEFASGYNEPFRFYSKDMRGNLLDAEEERALGREMEQAGLAALAALARWPEGLSLLFDAADRVARGESDAEPFSAGPEPCSEDISSSRGNIPDDEDSGLDEVASFFVTAVGAIKMARGDVRRMTEALIDARLTRGFLLKLANRTRRNEAERDFSEALGRQSAARDRMILSNLRLALSIAKKHLWSGFPIDDLVQEANIGLIKAVERYDWRKGFRFSTYATWWIRQQVTRFIADHTREIRIPVHMIEAINKMKRFSALMLHEMGRKPTVNELHKRLDMPEDRIRKLQMVDKLTTISMETPVSDKEDLCLGDFVEGSYNESPIDMAVLINLKETMQEALSGLKPREAKVLRMRFGIDMDTDHTLEEVGKKFDVTRERIRQIEAKSLKKLRYPERSGKLRTFLE